MGKKLNLDELLNAGKKIYVKNTSRPMGHIVLTFVTAHGKSIPRNIPRTWIPICLTDVLSPDIIMQSNELRQFINKGILGLVDPAEAMEILGEADAKEESQRINVSDFSNSAEATESVRAMENQYTAEVNPLHTDGETPMIDPVNNRVKATLLQVEANDLTEREGVAEFRVMLDELTSHDLTYIISYTKDGGPLKRFAFQVLSERNAVVDPTVADQPEETVVTATADDDEGDPPEDPAAAAAGRALQQP